MSVAKIKADPEYLKLNTDDLLSMISLEKGAKKPRVTLIKSINRRMSEHKPEELDIQLFYGQYRKADNDKNNKIRESIIESFGNGNLFPESERWVEMYNKLHAFWKTMMPTGATKCDIISKGGRGHHHDFIIRFSDSDNNLISESKVEFKNNASSVNDCPQFVSPMRPSIFFKPISPDLPDTPGSYEELHYRDHLSEICAKVGAIKPTEEVYLKQVHDPNPECMVTIKEAYYRGAPKSSKYTGVAMDIDNYKFIKDHSVRSIDTYLNTFSLDITKMNEYLLKTQADKKYMLWSGSDFHYQEVDKDDYTIDSDKEVRVKNKNTLVYKSKSNKDIKIMLRWKNGNGVAFPALQIS
jgi:hypothetical protein